MAEVDFIKSQLANHPQLVHASNVMVKFNRYDSLSAGQQKAIVEILERYSSYLISNTAFIGYADDDICKRVAWLNDYYNFIKDHNYDNIFTSQGKLRSTILEEFMYILFRDFVNDIRSQYNDHKKVIESGSVKAYTNLFISAENLQQFIDCPKIEVNEKDQDFSIYRTITLHVENKSKIARVPIISVENKTYVDKTMLEGSIATAEKIKSGNPYSKFFIVTENYDVNLDVDPVYSRIDQIYVLRKNKRREVFQQIAPEVVLDFFHDVQAHMQRDWANVEQKMRTTGKII